jgi:hypothetical protein
MVTAEIEAQAYDSANGNQQPGKTDEKATAVSG